MCKNCQRKKAKILTGNFIQGETAKIQNNTNEKRVLLWITTVLKS
jgi:hypothetical protein